MRLRHALMTLGVAALAIPISGIAWDGRAGAWIHGIAIFDAAAGAFLAPHDIVIRGTRIESVAPAGGPPVEAKYVIDGTGKFAVPGLFDDQARPGAMSRREAALLLATGVTSIRANAISAADAERWRRDLDLGRFYGPRLVGPAAGADGRAARGSAYDPHAWLTRLAQRPGPAMAAALQEATLGAAERAGRDGDLGSIVPGKIADLVIVQSNPLQDPRALRDVDAVIFRGDVLTRAHLNMLRQGRLKPGDDLAARGGA